jgi:predicted Fe-Mo cluster-binding NifX family protein
MESTRIAIATADGVSVCDHLARSAAFVVVEVNSGVPGARETRARGTEACGNHATFVEMLAGCDAVICGGIGQGAVVSLAAHGIRALVSPAAAGTPVDDALQAYLEGRLATSDERVCLCGPHSSAPVTI